MSNSRTQQLNEFSGNLVQVDEPISFTSGQH
jgi:hypothetical protein